MELVISFFMVLFSCELMAFFCDLIVLFWLALLWKKTGDSTFVWLFGGIGFLFALRDLASVIRFILISVHRPLALSNQFSYVWIFLSVVCLFMGAGCIVMGVRQMAGTVCPSGLNNHTDKTIWNAREGE